MDISKQTGKLSWAEDFSLFVHAYPMGSMVRFGVLKGFKNPWQLGLLAWPGF